MPYKTTLSVIGGDDRQFYIAEKLKQKGFKVKTFGIDGHTKTGEKRLTDALNGACFAVLPLPVTKDGFKINSEAEIPFENFVKSVPEKCRIFAGKLPPAFKDCLENSGLHHFDYYEDPAFVWKNADISAEGAVSLLMQSLGKTLNDSSVLICGYGRIGKCLAAKLIALGVNVTVAARNENDLMLAMLCGCKIDRIDYSKKEIINTKNRYDAVINTIPSWIFSKENCGFLKNTVYIELASAPYGGKAELLREVCDYKSAPGVPGRYAPESAAKAVFISLIKYIESEENG